VGSFKSSYLLPRAGWPTWYLISSGSSLKRLPHSSRFSTGGDSCWPYQAIFPHVKFGFLLLIHQNGEARALELCTTEPKLFDVNNERGFDVRGAHPSKIATSGAASLVMVLRKSKSRKGGPARRFLTLRAVASYPTDSRAHRHTVLNCCLRSQI